MTDTDDDRKQSKSFSLTKGLLRRFHTLMEDNNLPASEQSELAEFLLDAALAQVESGQLELPIQNVSVLKKTR